MEKASSGIIEALGGLQGILRHLMDGAKVAFIESDHFLIL